MFERELDYGPQVGAREVMVARSRQREQTLREERSLRMQRVTPKVVGQMYSYVSESGILFKSDDVFGKGDYIEVAGSIYDGPESIGTWTRTWNKEEDGWIVNHNNFDIAPELDGLPSYQGRGIALEWLRACEERYLELGVKEIRLRATQVGSYAWARAGYNWTPPDGVNLAQAVSAFADSLESSLKVALASGEITLEEEQYMRDQLHRHITEEGVDIGAIAAIDMPGYERMRALDPDETEDRAMGRKTGRRQRSLGQILLTDREWDGSKEL
jgi:GNAT superfamily N-acetyltransferase